MVRKYENKVKPKAKPAKTTRTRRGKKVLQHVSPQTSSASELDFTLPEGNHLDSFDQFRTTNIQVLKEKQVLKKNVRASFNRDSSIEVDSDATCSSFSMSISSVVPEDNENIDPSVASDQIAFVESINSENSFRFSKSIRKQRHLEKAKAKAIEPKKPTLKVSDVNIKNPAFYVSPIRIRDYLVRHTNTSTPERFFADLNMSSIHTVMTDESVANLVEAEKSNHKERLGDSLVRPAFIATRRPKPIFTEPISPIGRKQSRKTGDKVVEEAAAISNFSAMDMSSIAEWQENVENDKMCTTVSDDSFEVAKPKPNHVSSIVDTFNLTENKHGKSDDKRYKTEECSLMNSFELPKPKSPKGNDSSSWLDNTANKQPFTVSVDVHPREPTIETISVSSTSTTTTLSASSPSTTTANQPQLIVKPHVGFDASNSVYELSVASQHNVSSQKLVMKGGKWRRTVFESRKNKVTQSPRRTLDRKSNQQPRPNHIRQSHANVLRRKSIFIKDIPDRKTINNRESQRKSIQQTVTVLDESDVESICSADFSPKSTPINVLSKLRSSHLQPIADSVDLVAHYQQSAFNLNTGSQLSLCDSSTSSLDSVVNEIEKSTASLQLGFNHDELKLQLLKRCKQTDVLPFDEIYSASVLKKCRKIGEGVFGEVFLNETSPRSSYVLKIIPIEGTDEINGAQQKRFDEILQEVIISQELSGLRHVDKNRTSGFVEVLNVRLVEGRYPAHLLDLWNDYDTRQNTENDCPDVFGDDQLYVIFELANCGSDLEAHVFKNAEQSYSAFKQVAISLAVAESEFEFEHRDLHWGNVLVAPTTEKSLTFNLNGKSIEIRTHGIKATIIDYTLSRLVYKNCCLFQDLAADPELFDATGDYQYDIYRLMRTQTSNNWAFYEPFTNVLWLHYTIDKMIGGVNYTAKKGVKHRQAIDKMIELRDELLDYRSASDYIETSY